jgi:GH15 family glucan-1,4-alpha-glucosidase
MWVANYYIARANTLDALKPARDILNWTKHYATPSGILAEQIHPRTCEPLSVSPLTWSHAAFVIAVHEYINKYHELQA